MNTIARISKAALYLFVLTSASIVFSGCHKEKEAVCTIKKINTGNEVITVSYNTNGTLREMTANNDRITYDYSGNKVISTNSSNGNFILRTVTTQNEFGLATNVRREYDQAGNTWTNESYEYNGQEVQRSVQSNSTNNETTTTNYIWIDHNLKLSKVDNLTTVYEYYEGKKPQQGDLLWLSKMLNNYEYIRTKDLIKTIGGFTSVYTYDTDGKISSFNIISSNSSTEYRYEYECK